MSNREEDNDYLDYANDVFNLLLDKWFEETKTDYPKISLDRTVIIVMYIAIKYFTDFKGYGIAEKELKINLKTLQNWVDAKMHASTIPSQAKS